MRDFARTAIVILAVFSSAGVFAAPSSSDVVVRVNGVPFLKKHLEDDVKLRMKLLSERKKDKNYLAKQEQRFRKTVVDRWINSILLKAEADRLGIKPTENDRKKLRMKYLRTFRKRRVGFEKFRADLAKDGLAESFDRNFDLELRANAYVESRFKEEATITEKDIDKAQNHVKEYNARAALTNDLICALASNICTRARAGEDFAKLADKYNQDDDCKAGGYVGECDEADFTSEDPSFVRTVWALKAGEISDVIDTTDSYVVVKMLKHIAKSENTDKPAIEIAWIKIYRPQMYEVYNRKELRRLGERQQREKIFKREVQRLRKNAKIEYPSVKSPKKANKVNKVNKVKKVNKGVKK